MFNAMIQKPGKDFRVAEFVAIDSHDLQQVEIIGGLSLPIRPVLPCVMECRNQSVKSALQAQRFLGCEFGVTREEPFQSMYQIRDLADLSHEIVQVNYLRVSGSLAPMQ